MDSGFALSGMRAGRRGWLFWPGLFALILSLLVLVYSKALHAGLIYDDVASLLYFHPAREFRWYHSFLPLDNGFIRPVYTLCDLAIYKLAGTRPFFYHLHALMVHGAVAVAGGWAFCVLMRARRRAGALVSLSIALAASAFPVMFMQSNTADSMMALGMLIAVGSYSHWLRGDRAAWLAAAVGGVVLAVGSKETGIAVVGVLGVLTWVSAERRRGRWIFVGALLGVCLAYAGLVVVLQRHHTLSYANQGYASAGVVSGAMRGLKYLASTLFPGCFVMKPMWPLGAMGAGVSGLLQVAAGAFILASAVYVMAHRGGSAGRRESRLSHGAALYLGAAAMLAPTVMVDLEAGPHSPIGRYLYASMTLVMMALGCVALAVGHGLPRALKAGATLLWAVWLATQVAIVRGSPGTAEYYRTAREWTYLVRELKRITPDWPPMQAVTFFTGPEYGSMVLPEPYGLALMRVYLPNLLANYQGNRVPPETTRAYRFDGKHLRPVDFRRPDAASAR